MSEAKPSAAWPNGAPRVGDRAQRTRSVTRRDIELFTEISGDRNPLHYDESFARASRFGAVVAEDLPGPGTVFLHVDWSFKAPVRPGDTITGVVEVLEVRDDKPITKLETAVVRGDGVTVLEGTALCYTMSRR
jgi:acyl dehydratase